MTHAGETLPNNNKKSSISVALFFSKVNSPIWKVPWSHKHLSWEEGATGLKSQRGEERVRAPSMCSDSTDAECQITVLVAQQPN